MTEHLGFWSRGDRQAVTVALVLAAGLFLSPLFLLGRDKTPEGTGEWVPGPETPVPTIAAKDKGRPIRLLHKDGTVEELSMQDYLWGVVAAEMPASFELEALKAQACAARTYTVSRQDSGSKKHPEADICTDSACCQAYISRSDAQARWGLNAGKYTKKIEEAVAATDGLGILYQGKPIQALFFSSAPGKTVDAVAVWGNSVDYLKSVDSPEGKEVPNYQSQVVLTTEEVRSALLGSYPAANLSGPPESWFSGAQLGPGGTVTSILAGGVSLTGGQVRSLFGLRSAAFTVDFDGKDTFTFHVTGHGHGVGMSQYGANTMASEGATFGDILTWYYTGVNVDYLW